MFAVLFSLIAAMAFGLGATLTYGVNGLTHHAWVETLFWSLIGTGVAVAGVNAARCSLCDRVSPRFSVCQALSCR